MPKGEAMRPRTKSAAPRVFPRGDFLWSPAMKMRPGNRARMSSRAPRVFPRRDLRWNSSRARVEGHATADGKKVAAAPCTSSRRGKRVLPSAKKKGPTAADSQKEEAAAPHISRCGGTELVAGRRGRATADSQRKGRPPRPVRPGAGKGKEKGDDALAVLEVRVD